MRRESEAPIRRSSSSGLISPARGALEISRSGVNDGRNWDIPGSSRSWMGRLPRPDADSQDKLSHILHNAAESGSKGGNEILYHICKSVNPVNHPSSCRLSTQRRRERRGASPARIHRTDRRSVQAADELDHP